MAKQFISSVGSVFTGTLIAQIIPIAGTLVLARIFDPASFGIFSAWLGGALFLAVVLTGRFEMGLAVEADGAPRNTAVVMIFLTVALASVLAAVFVFLGTHLGLGGLVGVPVSLLFLAVPVAVLVSATQTLQNWAAADGRYRQLSIMRIVQASSIVGLQIGFGMFYPDAGGLGFGYFAGALVGMLTALSLRPLARIDIGSSIASLRAFWRSNRRFPMFSLPADSVNAAAAQLPVLLVTARFGAEAAGLLAMALRMLGAPMSLLAASVLDVFKRHAGLAYRERGECRAEYLHALRILAGVAAFATVAIAVGAEPFFALAFGNIWLGAGTMALWLLPRFIIGFVASPLSYMVYVAGKQHLDLIWQLSLLAMTMATLALSGSEKEALVSYGLGYGGLYLVYLVMSYRFSLGNGR